MIWNSGDLSNWSETWFGKVRRILCLGRGVEAGLSQSD